MENNPFCEMTPAAEWKQNVETRLQELEGRLESQEIRHENLVERQDITSKTNRLHLTALKELLVLIERIEARLDKLEDDEED